MTSTSSITIPVKDFTRESVIAAMAAELRKFGCTVNDVDNWESPMTFRLRVGKLHRVCISPKHLDHKITSTHCPDVLTRRSATGRLLLIGVPCPDFESFVVSNMKTNQH